MKKTTAILSATALTGIMLLSACNKDPQSPGVEYMPDMYRSPSYEVYQQNGHFSDSVGMLQPVGGTVARNFIYFEYPSTNEGYEAAGRDVHNPLPNTPAMHEEGKRLYGIYCTHCHGDKGQGDGSIVALGKFPPPPSYSKANSSRGGAMKDLTDGKIYHTITYGLNLMGSHASQLLPDERWKIVMYVHDLQHEGESAAAATDSTKAPADSAQVTAQNK